MSGTRKRGSGREHGIPGFESGVQGGATMNHGSGQEYVTPLSGGIGVCQTTIGNIPWPILL